MPDPLASTRDVNQFSQQPMASGDATIARDDQTLPVELPKSAEGGGLAFAPPEHAGEIGKLGRYRVLKELGRGGMGAVFLGYDGALQRKVALKVMLPRYAENEDSRERFLREARTAAMVKSDHVVTIFDVGQGQGIPFIAMEYLLGCPLDQYLKTKGELPLAHALRIAREAALGLAAAHELGLVHRDIKPGNLWLEAPRGRVKLLDFGLARIEDDDLNLTHTGAMVGTPAYMSPEQARGHKVDHRSDLFSLGIVLYRLASGEMPFQGSTTMAILTSLAVDIPVPLRQHRPELPVSVESLVARLLAKDPSERPQSGREVAKALRVIEQARAATRASPSAPFVDPAPLAISAQTQGVWEGIDVSRPKAGRPKRQTMPWPMILGGAGLVSILILLVAMTLWRSRPKPIVGPRDTSGAVSMKSNGNAGAKTGTTSQPVLGADPDRRAAEYVLSIGGWVQIDDKTKIEALADLPKERFALKVVNLYRNNNVTAAGLAAFRDCRNLTYLLLQNTNVSDEGLVHFKGCVELSGLILGFTQVGDPGLANFKDCQKLSSLHLSHTRVTDAGLANFKDCKNLKALYLDGVQVSDAGLAHFKDCPHLTHLDLRKTKVTRFMIEEFRQALPQCKIEHDGGTIEPAGIADPDRKAAEYVLSLGGSAMVSVNGKQRVVLQGGSWDPGWDNSIEAVSDLPNDPFLVTHVALRGENVTDAGLANFRDCKNLSLVRLDSAPNVSHAGLTHFKDCEYLWYFSLDHTPMSDAGLVHLKGYKNLKVLTLNFTQVSDAGMAHLKDCMNLNKLEIGATQVGDEGLVHLKDCKQLTQLHVVKSRVTARGIAEFAEALPRCKITHDGGTIEPKP